MFPFAFAFFWSKEAYCPQKKAKAKTKDPSGIVACDFPFFCFPFPLKPPFAPFGPFMPAKTPISIQFLYKNFIEIGALLL